MVCQGDHCENGTYLEIGSWAGLSAKFVADMGMGKIYCVDSWQGAGGLEMPEGGPDEAFKIFCSNLEGYIPDVVVPFRGTSLLWGQALSYTGQWADICFIDAGHDYEDVMIDIEAWRPHVKHGGILCGHDIVLGGVQKAVNTCFGSKWERKANLWWLYV